MPICGGSLPDQLNGAARAYHEAMDPLADVLAISGVRGTLGARIDAGADWGWWAAPNRAAAFHAVTSGSAWIAVAGEDAPRQLLPGDVLLLPRGAAHALGSDPAAVARTNADRFDDYAITESGAVSIGSGPTRTHVLCAHYEQDPAVTTALLDLLPDVVHVHATGGDALDDTVRLLARELAHPGVATEVVLNRLVDVLLVQLLRSWLASRSGDELPSWLGGLRDPVVGPALAALHADPSRTWTTEVLAAESAVSRATLARRFTQVVGESPGSYLTRWRMDLAARRLRDTDDPIDVIAQEVGYTSVFAFNRAFRRAREVPPGRFRTAARA